MKKMIIASTSTLFGGRYLDYLIPYLALHFKSVDRLLFIPYARPTGISFDAYTQQVKEGLKELPMVVSGIHEFDDAKTAIKNAQAIFVGGGNTFVLMDTLIKEDVLQSLRLVVENGTPYLGTSAGSNIVGPNVKTTNDMPIVHLSSLDSLNLVPFNINPHYLDPDPGSTHKGETRETRIKEFHTYNNEMVIGLREGSWIAVDGDEMILKGNHTARIFQKDTLPFELESGSDLMRLH
jgi:dipeptidase E